MNDAATAGKAMAIVFIAAPGVLMGVAGGAVTFFCLVPFAGLAQTMAVHRFAALLTGETL